MHQSHYRIIHKAFHGANYQNNINMKITHSNKNIQNIERAKIWILCVCVCTVKALLRCLQRRAYVLWTHKIECICSFRIGVRVWCTVQFLQHYVASEFMMQFSLKITIRLNYEPNTFQWVRIADRCVCARANGAREVHFQILNGNSNMLAQWMQLKSN